MDELDRLVKAFKARADSSALAKLDVLMDIERLDDPRVVPFLLTILADRNESSEVRSHLLKELRNGRLSVCTRAIVAEVIMQIASDEALLKLQVEAALVLGEFIHVPGVVALLGRLALKADSSIDLRYAAFTSLERATPTTDTVDILRQLSADETLGPSARAMLAVWHVA